MLNYTKTTVTEEVLNINSPLYYGADPTGVSDSTEVFQEMVNRAGLEGFSCIYLGANEKYLIKTVHLPLGRVKIFGEGQILLNSEGFDVNSRPGFILSLRRTNPFTGLYDGISHVATKNKNTNSKGVEMEGFSIDGNKSIGLLLEIDSSNDYENVDLININNVTAKRFFNSNVIILNGKSLSISESPSISNVEIKDCNFIDLAPNTKVWVDGNHQKGERFIKVKSIDVSNISIVEKMKIGSYIQLATDKSSISSTKGFGSASVYRIKSISLYSEDIKRCIIEIASGDYNDQEGFDEHLENMGLFEDVSNNSYVFVPDNYQYGILNYAPKFNTIEGSNVFTLSDTDSQIELAKYKNLYIGKTMYFRSGGLGIYSIREINGYEVVMDKPALGSFSNIEMRDIRYMSNAIIMRGYNPDVIIEGNRFSGGDHLVRSFGCQLSDCRRAIDIPTTTILEKNYIEHAWMGWEEQNGTSIYPHNNGSLTINGNSFDEIQLTENKESFTIQNTNLFKVEEIDGHKFLCDYNESNPSFYNSISEGDIIRFDEYKYLYEITSIPDDVSSGVIGVNRYYSDKDESYGGFFKTSIVSGKFYRTYAKGIGTKPSTGKMIFRSNRYSNTIRSSGGGYAASLVSGGNVKIENNELDSCQNTSLEIYSEKCSIQNNTFNAGLFSGQSLKTGVCFSTGGRTTGKFLSVGSGELFINGNEFNSTSKDLSVGQFGSINLTIPYFMNCTLKSFDISRNNLNGTASYIVFGNNYENSQGQLRFIWDRFRFSNNVVNVTEYSKNNRPFPIIGMKNIFSGNEFYYEDGGHEYMFRTEDVSSLLSGNFELIESNNYFDSPLIKGWLVDL